MTTTFSIQNINAENSVEYAEISVGFAENSIGFAENSALKAVLVLKIVFLMNRAIEGVTPL